MKKTRNPNGNGCRQEERARDGKRTMLKQILKRWIAPKLREWLETRALHLPSTKRVELAKRTKTSVEVVDAIHEALRMQALERVEEFLERL